MSNMGKVEKILTLAQQHNVELWVDQGQMRYKSQHYVAALMLEFFLLFPYYS